MLWRHVLVLASLLLPVGAAGACSDPPAKPKAGEGSVVVGAGGGGGGVTGEAGVTVTLDASVGDGGDAGACNDLVAGGQVIDRAGVAGDPPAGKGGTVVDGDYDLTDYTVYTGIGGASGPTGITAKARLRIAAGALLERYEFGGTGSPSVRSTASTYGATAATFSTTQTCPSAGLAGARQFTANDPLLILIDTGTKEAFTFTKR
jgi:hypothetical protein